MVVFALGLQVADRRHAIRSLDMKALIRVDWRRLAVLSSGLGAALLVLLALTGYLFFYNHNTLLIALFGSVESARRIHLLCGGGYVFLTLMRFARIGPWSLWDRVHAILTAVLGISGAMLVGREHFGFTLKYGLAVVHLIAALVLAALSLARWHRRNRRGG